MDMSDSSGTEVSDIKVELECQQSWMIQFYATLVQSKAKQVLFYFKSFAGIDPTGELDAKTVDLMNTPRCGVKDTVGLDEEDRDEDDSR